MRRYRWTCLCAGAMAAVATNGCRIKDEPIRATIISYSDFAVYSVASAPDETHVIPVAVSASSKTWYREQTPGLDLRYVKLASIGVAAAVDGPGAWVKLPIDPKYHQILSDWMAAHGGQSALFVFRGEPVGRVAVVPPGGPAEVAVRTESSEQAEALAKELRSYAPRP
jgi:hypothetical protein